MPNNRPDLLVGVTGGIGSGKSTVCDLFRGLGRTVIAADRVARDLMEHDPALRREVLEVLGQEAFGPDGTLNRMFVAERIFEDAGLRKRLNACVHPRVIREILRRIAALPAEVRQPYLIIEAALVYESGLDEDLDYVIVVHASEGARLARVMTRDGLSHSDALRRARAQLPAEELRKLGDFVLTNEGPSTTLAPNVAFLDRLLSRRAN